MNFPNAPVLAEDKYRTQEQVNNLVWQVVLVDSTLLRKWCASIDIDQEAVRFTTHGVLSNIATTREIISLLTKVADRVESQPVS